MRKFGVAAMLGLALVATACAKKADESEGVPADTATLAPAPAPMPMDTGTMMDTTVMDTMHMTTTSM